MFLLPCKLYYVIILLSHNGFNNFFALDFVTTYIVILLPQSDVTAT